MTAPSRALPLFPTSRLTVAHKAIGVLLFVLLTALAAQIRMPVPGTPVPMTMQTLAVTMCALTLGPGLGMVSMAIYVALGLVGFPVFASGASGVEYVFGGTAGYLLGFVLSQPLIGRLSRTRGGDYAGAARLALALIAGYAIIFALGVIWLMFLTGSSLDRALEMGFWPFPIGMLIKGGLAMALGLSVVPWACRTIR